ncbi:MAG: reverse transcriptase family protein [Moorellales bacterium]
MHIVSIPKGDGRKRTIYVPSEAERQQLRELLPDLNLRVERAAGEVIHGFVPGRSPVTNALQHVGRTYTVTMDLEDFFDHVTAEKLRGKLPAEVLGRVLVDGAARQGLPTSPAVANIAAMDMDKAILRWIERTGKQIVYTRYADDLAFSFDDPELLNILPARIKQIVNGCGFRLNPAKVRVYYAGAGRRIICGVAVGEDGIYPTREAKRRLRAARHQGRDGAARGLEEWCKLKPPRPKEGRPERPSKRALSQYEALRQYWRLPRCNFAAAVAHKELAERDLGGDCFVTNDPAYLMGMSNYTNGWTSCMRQPDGEYRRGVIAWLRLPGASLAVYLGQDKRTYAGVTRRVMRARCLVYRMADGTLAYDRVYALYTADADTLKRALRAAGFVWVGDLPEGLRVAGSVPAYLPCPYLDNLQSWVEGGQRYFET